MQSYLNMLRHVLENGVESGDRTGTGTKRVFGYQFRHSMADGFPLLTTKKMYTRITTTELVWMMRGMTNIKFLHDNNVTIWDEWADANGDLGPIYGAQWRNFQGVDQLKAAFDLIQNDPDSRRIIVSAWNPKDLPNQALPPCHMLFQFGVHGDVLHLHMVQRSADLFLGVPYNISFYALMLAIFARATGKTPGDLVISFTDLHLYSNHLQQAATQSLRDPMPLPKLEIYADPSKLPWEYEPSDLKVVGYHSHPEIKADVAV